MMSNVTVMVSLLHLQQHTTSHLISVFHDRTPQDSWRVSLAATAFVYCEEGPPASGRISGTCPAVLCCVPVKRNSLRPAFSFRKFRKFSTLNQIERCRFKLLYTESQKNNNVVVERK